MNVRELDPSRWTLVEALRMQARRLGEQEFLRFVEPDAVTEDATKINGAAVISGQDGSREGVSLSFAGLDSQSDLVAAALAELGVGPGDRVVALAGNSPEFLVAMLATHKRRAIFTPVNTELIGAFLEHQVRNAEPKVILVDAGLAASFEGVDTTGLAIARVVVIGEGEGGRSPAPLAAFPGGSWTDLLRTARPDPASVLEPEPADVCTIMYTSGTTGPSKGVLLPQAHCFLFAKGAADSVGLQEGVDRYFVCMPFFHANALLMQVFACLVAGTPATVVRRFSVSSWLDQLIDCGATATNALGVMPEFIFRQPPDPRDREHRVTRIMAVPLAEEWGAAFEERFGVRLIQGYGMTEINMVAYSDPADPVMAGCAGRVLEDYFEVVVADPETDLPLPAGESGEILVRPRRPFCFNQGYFRMPDKTVEAYRNLWFHTGDAGRFDAEGRLFFIDRLKDRIRRRGENISSYEIEQVLNEYPAVLESAAVGIRVAGAGGEEEIKAVLVLHPGDAGGFDPVALLDYCAARMPRYDVPRFVEVVDGLDKTPSGKIRKQGLRDAGVSAGTWDRDSVGYQLTPRPRG